MPPKRIPLLVKKQKPIAEAPITKIKVVKTVPTNIVVEKDEMASTSTSKTKIRTVKPEAHAELSIAMSQDIGVKDGDVRAMHDKTENIKALLEENNTEEDIILNTEQQEALIEKLETRKYELKTRYRSETDRAKKDELRLQYEELGRLLSSVKECDAWDKVYHNQKNSKALRDEFRTRYKQLARGDFAKIIDLTAPKGERKPDEATEQIWHKSKTVIFKGKGYREAPTDKQEKFNRKMKPKPMPAGLRDDVQRRLDGNVTALHVRQKQPELLRSKKYDPLTFKGLSSF